MSDHSNAPALPAQDDNQLIAERREKLKALRQQQAQGGEIGRASCRERVSSPV